MSQLDSHIAAVRRRLAMEVFFRSLSLTLLVAAGMVLLGVIVVKAIDWLPPQPWWWVAGLAVIAVAVASVFAVRRQPDRIVVASAIDAKLGLQEKISTALFARGRDDPFAIAAVRDAEVTAAQLSFSPRGQFPLSVPKLAYVTVGVASLAWILSATIAPLDLFHHEQARQQQAAAQRATEASKKQLESALAVVNAAPPAVASDERVQLAKQALNAALARPGSDPAQAARTSAKALQDVEAAAQQQIKNNEQYAQAREDEKMLKQLSQQPMSEPGAVNDARHELANGEVNKAIKDLSSVVANFDKMDVQQQKQAAEQMKQLAAQLAQQANATPTQQKQMQQQLQQQLGLNQQQAQQAQQLLQQAAAGNPQAQKQLQQMAQQALSQMNNGQGPTQQQKQQIQQMMQQMQANAGTQAQAQQLAQAAQQMAQAMQQQSAQKGQQQANAQQQNGAQKQQGQQQGQQQSQQQGQPSGQQQGQQQGQQPGPQAMANAMQQMQAQLQQMQATVSDAQEVAALSQAAQNGLDGDASGGQSSPTGSGGSNRGQPQPDSKGQGGKGQGNNGGGKGFGSKGALAEAPYSVTPELSKSQDNDSGRLLATNLVKAGSIRGESRAELHEVAASAIKDPTDEIDQDRVSRQAQGVVRNYFRSMEDDAAPVPTTQPQ